MTLAGSGVAPLLSVEVLSVDFATASGRVRVVEDVTFEVIGIPKPTLAQFA